MPESTPGAVRPPFAARILAVQALYQAWARGDAQIAPVIAEFIGAAQADRLEGIGAKSFDQNLFSTLVTAVFAQTESLDDLILGVISEAWQIERLDPVLLALLRIAAHELGQGEVVAPQRLISQYVQIAEGFFDGKEPGLVNATLDTLARALHPAAFDTNGHKK